MEIVLTVIEVLLSIALIVVVLLQSGKESGLSGALSGNNDTYLSKNKGKNMDQMLAKSTKWIALAWIIATLLLSLI
ncbi:MAG: preprotein translocase subunit SecG [Oscillospiraceae bacterium]|nr:preprotein translocase subunit SecG [Oscillospiraceae bacterium]